MIKNKREGNPMQQVCAFASGMLINGIIIAHWTVINYFLRYFAVPREKDLVAGLVRLCLWPMYILWSVLLISRLVLMFLFIIRCSKFVIYYFLYFCLLVVLVIVSVFVISSTLNGNNGEWTNSDDVDTPRKYDDVERAKRVKFFTALNKAKKIPINNSPITSTPSPLNSINGPSLNKDLKKQKIPAPPGPLETPLEKNTKAGAKQPSVKKSVPIKPSKTSDPTGPESVVTNPPVVIKTSVSKIQNSKRENVSTLSPEIKVAPSLSSTSVVHEVDVVPPPPPDLYYEIPDYGGFLIKGKICQYYDYFDGMLFLEGSSNMGEMVNIPWCRQFGREIPGGYHYVNKTLYKILVDKVGIIPDEIRNYGGIISIIRNMFVNFPKIILNGIFSFYCYRNSLQATTGSHAIMSHNFNQPYCTGEVNIMKTTISPIIDYCYNNSFSFVLKKGFTFMTHRDGKVQIPPTFETHKDLRITNANMRNFFQFTPHERFTRYANCANNFERALSRYFKCRSPINPITGLPHISEHDMYQRQVNLISAFPMDVITHTAHVCGAELYRSKVTGRTMLKLRKGYKSEFDSAYRAKYVVDNGNSNYFRILQALSTLTYLTWMWINFCDLYDGLSFILISYIFTPLWTVYDYFSLLKAFVKIPHPKAKLYSNYITDARKLCNIIENRKTFRGSFKNEPGKTGKVGRLFATIEEGTLADVVSAPILKFAFKQEVNLSEIVDQQNNVYYQFCGFKPWSILGYKSLQFIAIFAECQEAKSSDDLFVRVLACPLNTAFYIYYSDDGFLVINIGGMIYIFETDISSCDSSNKLPIFAAAKYLSDKSGCGKGIDILLAQCAGVVTLDNPDCIDESVTIQPTCYMEYSGTRLTTVLNNLASLAVALGIAEEYAEEGYDVEEHVDAIIKGASRYGYVITCAQRTSFNAVSFLKRSYNGTFSWLNFGCILRSFGSVHGVPRADSFSMTKTDFDKSSPAELTTRLVKMCLDSLVNEPPNLLVNALRCRLDLPPLPETLTRNDLNERYHGEEHEWDALFDCLATIKAGDVIKLPILEKIFNVDYGTKFTDLDMPEFIQILRDVTIDDYIF